MCRLTESDGLPELVARLSRDEPLDTRSRGRLIGRLAALLAGSAKSAGARAVASGRWLADVVVDVVPHLPIRDRATLIEHHDGRTGDALAEAMIGAASKATAAIGAAGGAVAAVEFVAPPALLTAPVLVSAETLAVVAVEIKLVAELHEAYAIHPPGGTAQRATAYAMSWAHQRGIDPMASGSLSGVLGSAAKRELRQRLVRRAGRNLSSMMPFLAGAVAGAELNRRETRRMAERILEDLRRR